MVLMICLPNIGCNLAKKIDKWQGQGQAGLSGFSSNGRQVTKDKEIANGFNDLFAKYWM